MHVHTQTHIHMYIYKLTYEMNVIEMQTRFIMRVGLVAAAATVADTQRTKYDVSV